MAGTLKKRECPIHWKPLKPVEVEVPGLNVKVDACPECQGIYLDRGEIKRITGHAELNALLTKHAGLDSDSPRVCPACGMVMDMEDADGVKVDVCLSCFGVWLDHGELEALKGKPDAVFDPMFFSAEKRAELARAHEVEAAQRKKAWRMFLVRLAGLDLIRRPR